uniref:RdRp n=1 Tax=viral metagenome TaxID=1070528 RepID=A0A2V0RI61_9ZZZZ
MYNYLLEAYGDGVIDYSCMRDWYELCFSGIMPDWMYRDGVKIRHRSVWASLRRKLASRPKYTTFENGKCKVVYNIDVKGGERFKTMIKEQRMRDNIMSMSESEVKRKLRSILAVDGTVTMSSTSRRFLRVLLPSCTTELATRCKITPDLALACWHASRTRGKSHCSVVTLWKLLTAWGIGGQMFSNLVMASLVNLDNCHVVECLVAQNWHRCGIEYYTTITKEVSEVARRSGVGDCPALHLDRTVSYHSLMYLQNLAGRFGYKELSSTDDIEKRTYEGRSQRTYSGGEWLRSRFDEIAEDGMHDVAVAYARGVSGRRDWSAEDFIANLTLIGTSGSAPTKEMSDVTMLDGTTERMGGTKTAWLNDKLTVQYLRQLFTAKPSIRGTGADKYECGKQRLLLPGPIQHWLLESIALLGGESRVYRENPHMTLEVRNMEELALLTTRLGFIARGGKGIASDFADHNILHKFRRMKDQWLRMAEVLDPGVSGLIDKAWGRGDYKQFAAAACRWAAAALDDVAARGKSVGSIPGGDRDGYVRLVRGLWSGWRSTTFINTTFNEHYQRTTIESFKRIYGREPLTEYHILGDDMAGGVRDEWSGLRFLEIIDFSGLDAQAMKQMLSNNRLEYLRLMYEDGASVWGNVNRAVSGLVSGDGQTSPVRAGLDTARAINESIHTVIRRSGCRDSESWRYTLVRYWATVEVGAKGNKRKVAPSQSLLEASSAHGGMGCGRLGAAPKELIGHVEMAPSTMDLRWLGRQLIRNGSKTAVSWMSQRLWGKGLKIRNTDVVEIDHAISLASGGLPNKVAAAIRHEQWDRLADWYDANRSIAASDVCMDEALYERAASRVRTMNPKSLPRSVWNPIDVLSEAVAISAGPLAPAGVGVNDFVTTKGKRMKPIAAIEAIGVPQAVRRLAHSVRLLGAERVQRVLRGDCKLSSPSSGMVPVTHRVIVDHCLVAELDDNRAVIRNMDDEELQRFVTSYSYAVEQAVVGNNYWRPQLNY